MTQPMTPREKVDLKPCPKCWEFYDRHVDDPRMSAEIKHEVGPSLQATDAILTALASGSGDHAELAKWIEDYENDAALDAAEDGDLSHVDDGLREFPLQRVKALIAENAALRSDVDRLKLAICGGEDVPGAIAIVTVEDCERFCRENHASRGDLIDRATEAERKLAEARGLNERAADLMKLCTEVERFEGVSTLNVFANMKAWLADNARTFLSSKEDERG